MELINVFCDMMPFSLEESYLLFGGTFFREKGYLPSS
jgi:hypothetical protein